MQRRARRCSNLNWEMMSHIRWQPPKTNHSLLKRKSCRDGRLTNENGPSSDPANVNLFRCSVPVIRIQIITVMTTALTTLNIKEQGNRRLLLYLYFGEVLPTVKLQNTYYCDLIKSQTKTDSPHTGFGSFFSTRQQSMRFQNCLGWTMLHPSMPLKPYLHGASITWITLVICNNYGGRLWSWSRVNVLCL